MATQATHSMRARSDVSDRQVAAVILMAAGWGWISGNFVDPFLPFFFGGLIDLIHFVPAAVLLVLSMRYFRASGTEARESAGSGSAGARTGISVVAIFSIVACAVFVVLGLTNPDPNSVGVHTIEDWLPVIVLNAGTFLWLSTLMRAGRDTNVTGTAREAETSAVGLERVGQ